MHLQLFKDYLKKRQRKNCWGQCSSSWGRGSWFDNEIYESRSLQESVTKKSRGQRKREQRNGKYKKVGGGTLRGRRHPEEAELGAQGQSWWLRGGAGRRKGQQGNWSQGVALCLTQSTAVPRGQCPCHTEGDTTGGSAPENAPEGREQLCLQTVFLKGSVEGVRAKYLTGGVVVFL